jgi:hypothetical protein
MNGGGGYGGGYDEVPVYGEKNRYLKYIPWAFYVLLFVLVLYNVIIALVYAFIDSRWAHFMLIMVLLLTYLSIGFMVRRCCLFLYPSPAPIPPPSPHAPAHNASIRRRPAAVCLPAQ